KLKFCRLAAHILNHLQRLVWQAVEVAKLGEPEVRIQIVRLELADAREHRQRLAEESVPCPDEAVLKTETRLVKRPADLKDFVPGIVRPELVERGFSQIERHR